MCTAVRVARRGGGASCSRGSLRAKDAGEESAVEAGAEFSGDEAEQGTVAVVGLDAGEGGFEVLGDQSVQSGALGPAGVRRRGLTTRLCGGAGGLVDEGERGLGQNPLRFVPRRGAVAAADPLLPQRTRPGLAPP